MNELFRDVELRMKHAVDHFHNELKTLRTGRASLSILDSVVVEYYGTPTPLSQVANLSVADANLITAQPWDPSTIGPIERAIKAANLGLNPSNDGKVIRIPIPPLTEERRKDLSRHVHKMAEEGRNHVRIVRREANEKLKRMLKEHQISEDEEKRALDEVQKITDQHIKAIDELQQKKDQELLGK